MSPAFRYTALITVLSLIPIGWHFGTVLGLWGTAPNTRTAFFIRTGILIGLGIVVSIIVSIVLAAASGDGEFEPNEREKLILRKSELAGYYVLAAGVVLVMWFAFVPMTPMQIANALLAAFAISEAFKVVAGAVLFRIGA